MKDDLEAIEAIRLEAMVILNDSVLKPTQKVKQTRDKLKLQGQLIADLLAKMISGQLSFFELEVPKP